MSETPGQVLGRLMDERRDRYTAEGLWWEDDAEMDALAAAFLAEMAGRDRCDDCGALEAAVAALRRDRDADLAAFSEIGDRLGRCEQLAGDAYGRDLGICDQMGDDRERLARLESRVGLLASIAPDTVLNDIDAKERLARCEGRDGETIDRLGRLERAEQIHERAIEHRSAAAFRWLNNHEDRLAALRARADDLGRSDAARRGEIEYLEERYGEMWDAFDRRLAALEARARDGGDPCPLCEGRGWSVNVPSGSMYPCRICDGSGRLKGGGDNDPLRRTG